MQQTGTDFEAPNLDDLSVDPNDMDEIAEVFDVLAKYARIKGQAMRFRESGRIAKAIEAEVLLIMIYKKLPEWAKW